MSHADPLAIPVGTVFAVVLVYLVIKPEENAWGFGWPRTLDRVLGRRAARYVLRACGLFTAALFGWLVVHESLALLGAG